MRKILFGVVLTFIVLFTYRYCAKVIEDKELLNQSSALIQKQLQNVSKLIVTEGHFSEVYNYEDSKTIFSDYITAEKKALVVVNAKVTVAYNLKDIQHKIDSTKRVVEIVSIPDYEITISPDLEYYDIQSDFLNPFKAEDYNTINESVKKLLLLKVEQSTLKSNAKNRLISELSNFFVLTKSLGWTLVYKGKSLEAQDQLETLLP